MGDKFEQNEIREKAIELHAQGLTRGEIAQRMGKTRNSVIGLLYRAGIRDEPLSKVARARKMANIQSRVNAQRAARRLKQQKKIVVPQEARAFEPDQDHHTVKRNEKWDVNNPSPTPQTILRKDASGRLHANENLTESCCRFPIGDPQNVEEFHLCGRKKVPNSSYCETHLRRTLRSPNQVPVSVPEKELETV